MDTFMKAQSYKTPLYLMFLGIIMGAAALNAQVTFQKIFGGSATDLAHAVQVTANGGYIVAGYTVSFGAGSRDVALIRLDEYGNTLWAKAYGESNTDYGWTVDQTTDGGFIVGTHSESYGAGSHDVMLLKTDGNGNIAWVKYYGGSSADGAYSLQQTSDGGLIIAAHTNSFGAGAHDIYLIKADANGDTLWTKTYGANSQDYLQGIHQTADSGYIMAAYSSGFGAGSNDFYLVRANSLGDTLWTKSYGGSGSDVGYSVQQTTDGGFIVAGYTTSFGAGNNDVYLIKLDPGGQIIWAKTYGGSGADYSYSVRQTSDGGFIAAGQTYSFGTNGDVYLLRTDGNGNHLWSYAYGGAGEDKAWSVKQTPDNGYIVAGYTRSFGEGNEDIYTIKTDASGNSGCNEMPTPTISGDAATVISKTLTSVSSGAIESIAGNLQVTTTITENLLCQNVTGIPEEEIENQGVQLYPNPLKTQAKLNIGNTEKYPSGLTLLMYDILGRQVLRIDDIRSEEIVISRGKLPAGVYFYKVAHRKEILKTGKIVLQ